MRKRLFLFRAQIALLILFFSFMAEEAQGQIANLSSSVGAINASMGGAATAMPLDASGSQFWNPASITDLEETELDINLESFLPSVAMESTLPADSLAPGLPATTLSGEVESSTKFIGAPSMAFVNKNSQSPWRWGILSTAIGGSAIDFRHSGDSPVTSPPPIGSGDIKLTGGFLQISPTLAYRLNKHWSVGLQPNFDITSTAAEPFSGAEPRDDNGDGIPTYPDVEKKGYSVGLGVQGGIYYRRNSMHLGASIKSPQWFLPTHLEAVYENGVKHKVTARSNIPMIVSAGLGYSGIPRVKLAVDGRYVDYANTTGFDQVGFTSSGVAKGVGWKNIWALACGVQYQLSDKYSIRAGYSYNQPVIPSQYTAFAIGSPSVINQYLSFGASYRFNKRVTLAAMYRHGLYNSSEGPIQTPAGAIPGSSIALKNTLNSFIISLIFKY